MNKFGKTKSKGNCTKYCTLADKGVFSWGLGLTIYG